MKTEDTYWYKKWSEMRVELETGLPEHTNMLYWLYIYDLNE